MANVISVSALNIYVKSVLESDSFLQDITLKGEISSFIYHQKSGHFYFNLKDERSSVKAVMFRNAAQQLSFIPENGMHVVVRCKASLYEKDGTFQIYIDHLFPDGAGAAQIAFEQLKNKLQEEGLLEETRKRTVQQYPRNIGLITSESGAALQDILTVTRKRYPLVKYFLYAVNVQGVGAEEEIETALSILGQREDLDCIIVARGGGSNEDLWVFNSEAIARAAVKSKIPVVSAIGHEVDFTILDFVADIRAATPSAAVEIILPDRNEITNQLLASLNFINHIVSDKLQKKQIELQYLAFVAKQLSGSKIYIQKAEKVHILKRELHSTVQDKMDTAEEKLKLNEQFLSHLNPENIFRRGFAAVMKDDNYQKNAQNLTVGDELKIRINTDEITCELVDIQIGEYNS